MRPGDLAGTLSGVGTTVRVLGRAGVIRPYGPRTLVDIGRVVLRWGTGPAGGFATLAARSPHQVGVVDELGELTWGELHRRSNSLARALSERGVREGDSVAVMCRNHRGFIDASVAVAKLGADILYLNTAFAGPQLVDVLEREAPSMVIHDEEFTGLLAGASVERRVLAWTDDEGVSDERLERLVSAYDESDLHPPQRHARIVILTSGTTGSPKGAPRKEAGIDAAVSLLSRMPLRAGWRTHIAAPLFHTWGFAHLALAMLLGSTVVLRRSFDPATALRTAQDERCQSMVVIPVMLQRMLALDPAELDAIDLGRVEVVASSGSALPATLAQAWMDRFGDNLYNIYGSTEVAYASIATPEDLRADPTSAGKPPYGTVVRILDEAGAELPQGETGRIFVGNGLLFEGYTHGGSKEVVDGLMSSGDVGWFDDAGRLHVAGRDDDMIVSGGENVFPQEVEDCLVTHEAVGEVAAIGVEDEDYGQRLRAFVVRVGEVSADELREHVKANLARFKVPREIVFVDELPRNATGKVLKRELARHGAAPDDANDDDDDKDGKQA
ncbi:acyl-CoA synthetase [Nocardioides sp. S5]|uniref:AMP-binding protein n=1 Tax=Nocardioides sp. S5 TaxID=2017486 RepID=UPI001A8E44FE|nr:AMP-binding protein [Nocardioides sp. S5]QSR30662.1 acyl-CoA synthetase [Nocardioides sp. S5]